MTQHDWVVDTQLRQGRGEQLGLSFWYPELRSGTGTMTKARPVKADYAVIPRKRINKAAKREILYQ